MTLLCENKAIVFNVYFLYSSEHSWRHFPFSKNDKGKVTISKKAIVSWERMRLNEKIGIFLVAWLSERTSNNNRRKYPYSVCYKLAFRYQFDQFRLSPYTSRFESN